MTPNKMQGTRESAVLVIYLLGAHSIASLLGTIVLCAVHAEAALIAIVAGAGGASTGALSAMLNQTEKSQAGQTVQSAETVNQTTSTE